MLKVRNQDSLRQFGIIVETLKSPLVHHGEELEMEHAWFIGVPLCKSNIWILKSCIFNLYW